MEVILSSEEQKNRRKGMITSIAVHLLLFILLLLPFLQFPIPPPGQKGILVNLGIPEQGQGQDRPETQNIAKVTPTPPKAPAPQPKVVPVKAMTKPVEPQSRPVVTTETPQEIAIRQQKEREAALRAAEERRLREAEEARIRAEEEARRQAEEEARRKAEEEARQKAAYEKQKKQFGDLIGGSGKGNTSTPGNQGDPDGDPDASKLEGISTGSGMVGGGLGKRGVLHEPDIRDNSQKTGRVVVRVCVDSAGDVMSANYTQRGSTTTDAELRSLAIRSAKRFKFTTSEIEKQCGTITIDFKLR